MKNIYLSFFLILCLFTVKAQNCSSDSVVITLERERGDNFSNTFLNDTFDLVNGISRTTGLVFLRPFLILNSNKDTMSFTLMKGTGSGYENKKKIEFTYDAISHFLLSRLEYSGTGTTWNLILQELWNYNVANLITDYTKTDTTGNIQKIYYTYIGNNRDSIVYQIGSGTSWVNDQLFNIIYSGGSRDSMLLKRWDTNLNTWTDSLSEKYSTVLNNTIAFSYSYFQGSTIYKNTYTFDSLDQLLSEVHSDSTNLSSFSTTQYSYIYIHNRKFNSSYSLRTQGCLDSKVQYTYDQNGVLLSTSSDHYCGNGSGSSATNYYDSTYSLTSNTRFYYGSASTVYMYWDYYYFSSDHISINYLHMNALGGNILYCMGDSVRPDFISGGGCGPFQYHWSPSIGLSSDSIAQPMICIFNDTITYTITISDTTGHTGQTTFDAIPTIPVAVTFDTSSCPGCPVVLQANNLFGATYWWYRNDTLIQNANGTSYAAINSGNYFVSIHRNSCIANSDTISLTLSGLTRLSGRVYWDRDSDCTYTPADTAMSMFGFKPFLVGVSRPNYNAILSIDSTGYFDIPIDTGVFKLKFYSPSNLFSTNCTGSDTMAVTVANFGDTLTGNDFPLLGDTSCRRLEVTVTTSQINPCFPATIIVNCNNSSLLTETNVIVNVTIPSELTVTGSSLPYTQSGNNYSFTIPMISAAENVAINIYTNVICNIRLTGSTLCIDAELTPKYLCSLNPDSSWDGSNVQVHSYCDNDSLACFVLSNQSLLPGGNMNAPSIWRLYKNNVLNTQGTFILNANSDTTLCFASSGSTYRLEVDETAGFPSLLPAKASLERCGPDTNSYVLGKINQIGNSQLLPFYYTCCHTLTNSFDPNIKSVQPSGIGPNNFISKNQRLTYRIDFQNTGTDTAHYVMVEDYIRPYLFDCTTIQFVGSSSPCKLEYSGYYLRFKFYNINLPDSGTSQVGSHGYVEFSIMPNNTLPNGSSVQNNAMIYFDFNSAIYTPSTQNTICDVVNPSVEINIDSTACIGKTIKFKATIKNGGTSPLPTVNWYYNGNLLFTHTDSLSLAYIKLNDSVYCTVSSTLSCAYPQQVQSNLILFNHYGITLPIVNLNGQSLISTSAYSYQWFLNDTLIAGATGQTIAPTSDGNYSVQVWDSLGCTAISSEYVYLTTRINKYDKNKMIVFPNPTRDFINIEYPSRISYIQIFDAMGKSLYFQKTSSNSIKVPVKEFNQGRYTIAVMTDDGKLYKPFVILGE